jgi:hypothetical protein
MYNRSGRGRGLGRGSGGGMGFGFRGASPPWPYVGRGRGGLPRCSYFLSGAGAPPQWPYQTTFQRGMPATPGYEPYAPQMTKAEELSYLKDQAEAIKGQLGELETRIKQLSAEKK